MKKTIGKYVVIILLVAIAFFLLLPLLDTPTAKPGQEVTTEEVEPQLFSSNPLTNLARKIYSMFAGKQKDNPQPLAAADRAEMQDELLAADPTRAAAQNTTADISEDFSVSNSDDEWQQSLINEDGSWSFVQQIVPSASYRGLHEVNASDSAYDRLLRLERQAKYTGGMQEQVPQSKWARFWNPIKQFFTGQENTQLLASSTNPSAVPVQPFYSMGASADQEYTGARTPGRYAKNPGFDMPKGAGKGYTVSNPEQFLKELLMDPEEAFETHAKNLQETAKKLLGPEDYKKVQPVLDNRAKEFLQKLRMETLKKISEDAQGVEPTPDVVGQTVLPALQQDDGAFEYDGCGGAGYTSAFHHTNNEETDCSIPPDPYTSNPDIIEQAREASKNILDNIFQDSVGKPLPDNVPDVPVLVVMGVSKPSEGNPFLSQANNTEGSKDTKPNSQKIYEKYIDWAYKHEECDKNPCVLTASPLYSKQDLSDSLQSGWMTPVSLGLTQAEHNQFIQSLYDQEDQDLTSFVLSNEFNISPYIPAYNLVSLDRMKEQMKETAQQHRDQNKGPIQVYTVNAANAQDLIDAGVVRPSRVFYNEANAGSFDAGQDTPDVARQGNLMAQAFGEHMSRNMEIRQDVLASYDKETMTFIMQALAEKRAKRMKEVQGKDLDTQMGLTGSNTNK